MALELTHEHPALTFRRDVLLRSINDRLGGLLIALGGDEPLPGETLPALDNGWLVELYAFALANAEDQEEQMESLREQRGEYDGG